MKTRLSRLRLILLERLQPDEGQAMLLFAAVVGVLGALATVGFREILSLFETLLYGRHDGLVATARSLEPWVRLVVPMLGGILAGLVLQFLRRLKVPEGPTDYMEAVTLGDGRIHVRASLLRAVSSAISISSGSSIGREASMVHLAALTSSVLGRLRHLPRSRLRLLVACGAAAGISTAYNAPIAGGLFVAEVVLRSFAFETLGPLIVASVVGNIVSRHFLGFGPIYEMPDFRLALGWDVVWFPVLGIVCGLLAAVFLAGLQGARAGFQYMHLPPWATLGLGGLMVGVISLAEPGVWGNGYSVVNAILAGSYLWQGLLLILVLKALATCLATGSGAVGGAFTPTLFVGAAVGALCGILGQNCLGLAIPMPAWIAAGMGAFLAACSHAPLMAVVMIFEMTGNAQIIVPLLLVCVLSVSVKKLLQRTSLYSRLLPSEKEPVLAREDVVPLLLRPGAPVIAMSATCAEAEALFVHSRWQHLYVLDAGRHFAGALSLHDFGPYLRNLTNPGAFLPQQMLCRDYPRISPRASLGEMLATFSQHSGERLPVIDAQGCLLGHICKTDLLLWLQESAAPEI